MRTSVKTKKKRNQSAHIYSKVDSTKSDKDFKSGVFSFLLLAVLSVLFVLMCLQNSHIQDDAFITFRYVNNFFNGHGLVFNPGENVEGFTSILWVMILIVVKFIGIDLLQFSQIAGVAFGIISIWITYFLTKIFFTIIFSSEKGFWKSRMKYAISLLQVIPSGMLSFTGAFQYWAVSGMEVTLFISLSLLSIYLYMSAFQKNGSLTFFSVCVTLSSLVRPEGMLLFTVIMFHYWFHLYTKMKNPDTKLFFSIHLKKEIRTALLIFTSANFLLFLFRIFYYGYPLPNTFYAKTGLSYEYFFSGLTYIWDFFKMYLLYGTIFIMSLFIYLKKELRSYFWLLISITLIFFFYTIIVGGDVLPLFRFVLPVLPLVYILFVSSLFLFLYFIQKNTRKRTLTFGVLLTIIISVGIIYFNYTIPREKVEKFAYYEDQLVQKMSASGKWLAEKQSQADHKLVVAATTIGAVSYYSNVKIIDMLGLTDEIIAHNPQPLQIISGKHTGWKERNYNIGYILSQNLDFIYFSTGIKPSAYAEHALFLSEEFVNYYYPYFFNAIGDFVETIYKRKSISDNSANFIHFNDNPNFDSNYVNIYNELLNIKSKPEYRERSFQLCDQLGKVSPLNFTSVDYQLGLLYEKDGNKNKVFEIMTDAASRDDYLSLAHFYLGKHYSRAKNYEAAKLHFELVQKYNPDYFEFQSRVRNRSKD